MAEPGRFEKAAQKAAETKIMPDVSWSGAIVPVSPSNGPKPEIYAKIHAARIASRGEAAT